MAGLAALLLLALHLLRHIAAAAAQAFKGAPLCINGLAFLALAERVFCIAHGLLGIVEALFALHALLLHPALQGVELFAQLTLALAKLIALLVLAHPILWLAILLLALLLALLLLTLLLLALIALALLLPLIALAAPHFFLAPLAFLEGAITQFLLLARHAVELVEIFLHLGALALPFHLARSRHLQIAHHLVELFQEALRFSRFSPPR